MFVIHSSKHCWCATRIKGGSAMPSSYALLW